MQCHGPTVLRNLCSTTKVKPSLRTFNPSFRITLSALGSLHSSHFVFSPQSYTTSEANITDNALKISSESGDRPPPEDPDEIDNRNSNSRRSKETKGPAASDSFARTSSPRGRPRGSSPRKNFSLSRRYNKSHKPDLDLPEWFLSRNVTLSNDLQRRRAETSDFHPEGSPRVHISSFVKKELLAHLSTGLLANPGSSRERIGPQKTHIYLHCAERGALYLLDDIVEDAARDLGANLVRLDYQDLKELLEDGLDPPMADLGFSFPHIAITNIVPGSSKETEQREGISADEENEDMDEEGTTEEPTQFHLPTDIPSRLLRIFTTRPIFSSFSNPHGSTTAGMSSNSFHNQKTQNRLPRYIDAIISAPVSKQKTITPGEEAQSQMKKCNGVRTIIFIRDFQSLVDNHLGQIIHQALLKVINARRRLGQNVLLVVSDDLPPENLIPVGLLNLYYHFIRLPASFNKAEKSLLRSNHIARIREINLRNLQSAIRQRCNSRLVDFDCPAGIHLDSDATSAICDLSHNVWDLNHVQRVASVAIGNYSRGVASGTHSASQPLTITAIAQASEDIALADQQVVERDPVEKSEHEKENEKDHEKDLDGKRVDKRLSTVTSKECNKHEQKLLGGVIDPGLIPQICC